MVVITGAGGFIGSVLAARLNEAGRSDLVIVDRFGTGDKWRNIAKRDFFEIVPVDGLFAWLDRFGDAVEVVFHLGAISSTTVNDADAVIANNLNYSIALWRWCAVAGRPMIYASSAATYGDGSAGFDDAGGIEDLKRLRPLNLMAGQSTPSICGRRVKRRRDARHRYGSDSNFSMSSDPTNTTRAI
jgi:ADP-L-glycero-D-manno-heptose 6-epimerase